MTKDIIKESKSLRDFFSTLVAAHIDRGWKNARLDLLACQAAQGGDGELIAREIEALVGVGTCGCCKRCTE